MGKVPVRLKEVVYTLSPFEQTVFSGLIKHAPETLKRKITENWRDVTFYLALPVVGTMWYAADYKEKEKQHHRH
ncbi:hypothetical protein WJX72_009756 [[Myrmecia] bisecta]|uniref:Cytochrome b-c1 complex subunit 8 n=1 Tax=[Myrmecia] bisecta TaxID=41462 RepID=A0AAW1PKJ0_9CHLO